MSSQAYNVSVIGSYPQETYEAEPTYPITIPSARNQAQHYLVYQKRTNNDVFNFKDSSLWTNSNSNNTSYYLNYVNATYYPTLNITNNDGNTWVPNYTSVLFNNNASIYFNLKTLRQTYKVPPVIHLFNFVVDPASNTSYGYIVYPYQVVLKPTGISKTTNGWNLNTTTNVISFSAIYFNSTSFETDAYNFHKQVYQKSPTILNLNHSSLNLSPYALNYNIYSARTRIDYPFVTFSNNATQYSSNSPSTPLETDCVSINLDSTCVTFSATIVAYTEKINALVVQTPQDVYTTSSAYTFHSTYICGLYNNGGTLYQTFQLAQGLKNASVALGDRTNTLLQFDYNLQNFYGSYTNSPGTYYAGYGILNSILGISYIADCSKIKATNETPTANLTLNGSSYGPNISFLTNDVGTKTITWFTKYPPHYYSYKVKISGVDLNYFDSNSLNFYLTTDLLSDSTTTIAYLSSYITSDFEFLSYNLQDNSQFDEFLSFKLLDISPESKSNIIAQYGSSFQYNYDLNTSPFVPVSRGTKLRLVYNTATGPITFSLRSSLSSVNGIIDAFQATNIQMGYVEPFIDTNPLYLEELGEISNKINISAKLNNSSVSWPWKDLNDSNISWWYQPNNLNLALNAIDSNGNFTNQIQPSATLAFGSNTSLISLSGYGPQTVSIFLSSQKYNQIANLSSDPALFNYFSGNNFNIIPIVELNNLEKIRTITLAAEIPYGSNNYIIPANTPLYWTWEYDDVVSPTTQPITAYNVNDGKEYNFASNTISSNFSSINIQVNPPYNYSSPKLHKITVNVYSNIKVPMMSGTFSFYVDEFPSPSVFNTDFKTFYTANQTKSIADTRIGINTITRATGSNLSLKFTPYDDSLVRFKANNTDLKWNINGKVYALNYTNPNLSLDFTSANSGLTSVSLIAKNAFATGWLSAHNIETSNYIYSIPQNEFNNPLIFRVFPEYAWFQATTAALLNNDPYSKNYYTYSYYPSAYGNKTSNSQTFYLSANKDIFTHYKYQNLSNNKINTISSYYELADIPYDINNVYINGLPLNLTAYNDTTYPEINGINYYDLNGTTLVPKQFNIFAQTKNGTSDIFRSIPSILPYNNLNLLFTVDNTTINLDSIPARDIYINQTITTIPPNAPCVPVDGTVTYVLSSYYWSVSSTVPYKNGRYKAFTLNYGDPYVPLYSGDLGIEKFEIYALPKITQQIPPSTFPSTYTKQTNLWNKIYL